MNTLFFSDCLEIIQEPVPTRWPVTRGNLTLEGSGDVDLFLVV